MYHVHHSVCRSQDLLLLRLLLLKCVSPVKELVWKGEHAYIGDGSIGPVTQKLYDTMTGMQWGKIPDTKGWIVPVEKKY